MAMLHTTPRLFSIILPVYNTPEAYLQACIDSLTAQTYPHWQAVLVDDGSQPEIAALCDRLCAADARLRVIHQPNGGVSVARNRGIDAAEGEYLLFVDPDDWVDADTLEGLGARLDAQPLDVLWFGFWAHWPDHTKCLRMTEQPFMPMDEAMVLDAKVSILDEMKRRFPAMSGSSCVMTVRRQWLIENDLRYPVGIGIGEDSTLVLHMLDCPARMGMVSDCYYHYRCHADSAIRRYRPEGLSVYRAACAEVAAYARVQTEQKVIDAAVNRVARRCLLALDRTLWHPACDLPLRERRRQWRAFAEGITQDCANLLDDHAADAVRHNTILRFMVQLGIRQRSYVRFTLLYRLAQRKRRLFN